MMRWPLMRLALALPCLGVVVGGAASWSQVTPSVTTDDAEARDLDAGGAADIHAFAQQYCLDCHDDATKTADLSLEDLAGAAIEQNRSAWERVVRRLRARQMPPPDADRPEEHEYQSALASIERDLDAAAARDPLPGRVETFRRLTRFEYQNAIRDLLDLDVDVTAWLPPDEVSHGFDNVTASELSPTLLMRYVAAAEQISRLAMGRVGKSPGGRVVRLPADLTQEQHVEGLPLGTRGGLLVEHEFPRDGVYEFAVRLMRDRNEHVEGLSLIHQMEVLIDRDRVRSFDIEPPADEAGHLTVDAGLKFRVPVTGGPHAVGVTFVDDSASLLETRRQPYNAHFNMHRHPRLGPAVYQVSITGPFEPTASDDQPTSETPSRRRILVATPTSSEDELAAARTIVATLARRAYRRPVEDDDLRTPLKFYREARAERGHEAGIEAALSSILVSPYFLFRIERDPPEAPPHTPYQISDLELASRLSFFLWGSIPDDQLLEVAASGTLSQDAVLEKQVRRMLADDRATSLSTNFAGQWLYLRNLDSITPDPRLFPDFDDNLRQAMRRETELLFDSVRREDRSVLDLVRTNETFLNERLAKHYGVPHVYGSEFRRVALDEASHRGGLLRQASILTVTSYATRTTPVIRGNWVLKNLVGLAPPPPPPDVPALADNTVSARLPIRERMAQHSADPSCAVCHNLMDPVGFSLENFDAIGRWRDIDDGRPVDATGGFPDGREFDGVDGLEAALLERPEVFVGTLVERLLTFALGRGVADEDGPAIRAVVRAAAKDDYRFSALVLGIVRSTPFQMRMTP
jgi:hypothetical protein